MRITAFGKTDRGRRRPNNEDDLAVVDLTEGRIVPDHSAEHLQVGEKGVLLAVCDGVGGRRAGEVASGLALEVLSGEMESLSPTCPKRDLFRAAVEKVNARVWNQARSDSALEGMATTLTAAVICNSRAIFAHVGDSRAYFLRGEKIRQITRDQSFVQSLVEAGAIREEEAAQSPYRTTSSCRPSDARRASRSRWTLWRSRRETFCFSAPTGYRTRSVPKRWRRDSRRLI